MPMDLGFWRYEFRALDLLRYVKRSQQRRHAAQLARITPLTPRPMVPTSAWN